MVANNSAVDHTYTWPTQGTPDTEPESESETTIEDNDDQIVVIVYAPHGRRVIVTVDPTNDTSFDETDW